MSNITLNDYTNNYKISVGGPILPPAAIMLVGKNLGTSQNNEDRLMLTSASIVNTYPTAVMVSSTNSVQAQSCPVIKIKSINVNGPAKVNISSINASSNIYCIWKKTAIVTTSSSDKITQLTDNVVTLIPTIKEIGINDIRLQLVSGKYYEIKLGKPTMFGKSSIDFTPSSLTFDDDNCILKGIPFIIGTNICTITMPDNTKVNLILDIIPLSISSGI